MDAKEIVNLLVDGEHHRSDMGTDEYSALSAEQGYDRQELSIADELDRIGDTLSYEIEAAIRELRRDDEPAQDELFRMDRDSRYAKNLNPEKIEEFLRSLADMAAAISDQARYLRGLHSHGLRKDYGMEQ